MRLSSRLYSFLHSSKFQINGCSVQFTSVAQSCLTLCDPMNCRTPGLPVHHQLQEFTQTRVHRVRDAIQPSHPWSSPSPPAPNPSQHQSLFQWVNSLHEVAKVLELQLWHHSFQRNPRVDLLRNGLVGSPCRNSLDMFNFCPGEFTWPSWCRAQKALKADALLGYVNSPILHFLNLKVNGNT